MKIFRFLMIIWLAVVGAWPAWAAPPRPAEPPKESSPDEILDLSIEQLMNLELIQTTIPGAHWHWEDDWMVGYQFMRVHNEGYRDGTRNVSNQETLKSFPTIHTDMTMDMHMFMLMYGPSNDVTLMFMLPYMDMSMNHLTNTGARFRTESSGFGDFRVSPIFSVYDEYPHRIQVETGLSFPTGSVTQRDVTPGGLTQLEYKMQTGSGTFDFHPAVTYLGQTENMTWGAQVRGVIRTGRNERGYRQGDSLEFTTWWSPTISSSFSPSLRVDALSWGNVKGFDPELARQTNPESRGFLQGGEQINLLLGLNFALGLDEEGRGHRFSIEGGIPIYQNLRGPQLKEAWRIGGAWNWTF